jgi:hypothetical protein
MFYSRYTMLVRRPKTADSRPMTEDKAELIVNSQGNIIEIQMILPID